MENNIFFKLKKEKFNPDIEPKLKNKEIERDNTTFNLSNIIYNPITNIIPNNIKSNNDLKLEKDNVFSQSDIKKLIIEKERERATQDSTFIPIQTKIINTQSKEISDFNQMKNVQRSVKDNKYNSILDNLKDLGILK